MPGSCSSGRIKARGRFCDGDGAQVLAQRGADGWRRGLIWEGLPGQLRAESRMRMMLDSEREWP